MLNCDNRLRSHISFHLCSFASLPDGMTRNTIPNIPGIGSSWYLVFVNEAPSDPTVDLLSSVTVSQQSYLWYPVTDAQRQPLPPPQRQSHLEHAQMFLTLENHPKIDNRLKHAISFLIKWIIFNSHVTYIMDFFNCSVSFGGKTQIFRLCIDDDKHRIRTISPY